jgi:hypothetical protein
LIYETVISWPDWLNTDTKNTSIDPDGDYNDALADAMQPDEDDDDDEAAGLSQQELESFNAPDDIDDDDRDALDDDNEWDEGHYGGTEE